MASAIAMMIGGAITNAFAFSGSNYLFSRLGYKTDKDRKSYDSALLILQQKKEEWEEERSKRLDFINSELTKKKHSIQKYYDVEKAMEKYYEVTGEQLSEIPEPKLYDFYKPSEEQKEMEIIFVIGGMFLSGILINLIL